jgi:hypothetical protein
MSKLWTFGDSFTAGNGTLPNEAYTKYWETEEDVIWPLILSKKLQIPVLNKGMGLFSNDKIIDTVIANYHSIQGGDLVIIGKTFPFRTDIPNKTDDELLTIAPNHLNSLQNRYSKAEIENISEMIVLFDSEAIKQRQDFRFNFLKHLIAQRATCIVWSSKLFDKFETIRQATDYFIDDSHWSYKGHKDFADFMFNEIVSNGISPVEIKNKLI